MQLYSADVSEVNLHINCGGPELDNVLVFPDEIKMQITFVIPQKINKDRK